MCGTVGTNWVSLGVGLVQREDFGRAINNGIVTSTYDTITMSILTNYER